MNRRVCIFSGFYALDLKKILIMIGVEREYLRKLYSYNLTVEREIIKNRDKLRDLSEDQWALLLTESKSERLRVSKWEFINGIEDYVLRQEKYMSDIRSYIDDKYECFDGFYAILEKIIIEQTRFGYYSPIDNCDKILEKLCCHYNLPEEFNDDFRRCLIEIGKNGSRPKKMSKKFGSEKRISLKNKDLIIADEEKKENNEKKRSRRSIPKVVREQVWRTYINALESECLVCGNKKITAFDFECGHVDADGEAVVENLRPICKLCNNSMSRENMKIFAEKYFPKAKVLSTFEK